MDDQVLSDQAEKESGKEKEAEKLEKALEKLNKRSAKVEEALRKFEDASDHADKLKRENTKESVDAHKKLYETKKKAFEAVHKKDKAQQSLNQVLKKAEGAKTGKKAHPSQGKHSMNSKQKHGNKLAQSTAFKFTSKEPFSLFTLAKHDGRLTLRNIKFEAADSQQFDEAIKKHQGQYLVVKKNQVIKTNCFDNKIDYQRLLGFAVLEGHLKPRIDKFNHPDQKYLTWVEGTGDMKDIVWKSVRGNQKTSINSLFAQHDKSGDGPVALSYLPKTKSLHVLKHDKSEHMPKQALGVGHFLTEKLGMFLHAPKDDLKSYVKVQK